jgi:hypothetical protein
MEGKYYARMKSSLTRKRVLKDPKFQLTRIHAVLLGEASTIASRIYRRINGERKKHALYREMTGRAIYMLREGKDKEAVFQCLSGQYLKLQPIAKVAPELHRKKVVKGDKPSYMDKIHFSTPEIKRTYSVANTTLLPAKRRRRCSRAMDRWGKQHEAGP